MIKISFQYYYIHKSIEVGVQIHGNKQLLVYGKNFPGQDEDRGKKIETWIAHLSLYVSLYP